MEEEVDLRTYIELLIRYWYWIVGLGVLGILAALVATTVTPATYEATATVAIARPRFMFQFDDGRVEGVSFDPFQLSRSYPSMATVDDILLSVVGETNVLSPSLSEDIGYLRGIFKATHGGDPNVVQLTVRFESPQEVAMLTNTWADHYAERVNNLYKSSSTISLFEESMQEARAEIEKTDEALAQFRSEHGLGSSSTGDSGLASELRAKTDLLMQYETEAARIDQLLQQARLMETELDDTASSAAIKSLMVDVLGSGVAGRSTGPAVLYDLQDWGGDVSLQDLTAVLELKKTVLSDTINGLESEVISLRAEAAENQKELDQLLRDRQTALDSYLALSNKLLDNRIRGKEDVAYVLSYAAAPKSPAGSDGLLNVAVGGIVGATLGALGVVFVDSWRRGADRRTNPDTA
jgi:uncharacterized protein involved in exopolysaccharide biosynthesis